MEPRVLVVAAMRSELRPFRRSPQAAGALTAVTGMGPDRAEAVVTHLLDEHPSIATVVMIGIAGGIGPKVAVGDLVVPEAVIDARTGLVHHPRPMGGRTPKGTLHTSGRFIQDPYEVAALVADGVVGLDMETGAVGAVCEERSIGWSAFRGISDHAERLPVDPAVLALTGPEGEPKPAAVARYVLTHPQRVPGLARLARGTKAAIDVSTAALVAALAEAE